MTPIFLNDFNCLKVVAISSCYYNSIALTECGHVFNLCYNIWGQLGLEFDEKIIDENIESKESQLNDCLTEKKSEENIESKVEKIIPKINEKRNSRKRIKTELSFKRYNCHL